MKGQQSNDRPEKRSLLTYFVLVFVLTIPIWVLGPVAERFLPEELTATLPVSSLMFSVPISAALILVRRDSGSGAGKRLLNRAFDYRRIRKKIWYVPTLLLWPAMMVLQYGLMKLMAVPLPDPRLPGLMLPVSFLVFFIAAVGEEVGWQGYAMEPLQERWGALAASIVVGLAWAAWHCIPFIQMDRTPAWIACQAASIVVARILTVWIYNNAGKSLFAVILFHAMNNVATVLLPGYGWHYDPAVGLVITITAAAAITFLWGPETLARFRYARRVEDAHATSAG
jgi:membrane protease YdiL (CAAX protease family)